MKTADSIREYLSALGKKGAVARKKNLTAKRRRAIAKKAARTRWAKKGGKK